MMDEQPMLVSAVEETMVAEVDPLGGPLPTYLSADEDEAVLSPSSGSPMRSVPVTPVTPRRDFHSAVENSPAAAAVSAAVYGSGSGMALTRETNVDDDIELDLKRKKRVIGRRLAVVRDEGETQSSESTTSPEEDISTTASSSRAKGKGVKRGRDTQRDKDKDDRTEGKNEEGSNGERKRKRKGKKETERKDTSEKEDSDGKYGKPKGGVEQVLENMSASVIGGAIMEWANKIDEVRMKSKNLQGKLSGDIKNCVTKIREGTTLMIIRAEATGDPHFLRMRNSELATQLREAQGEIACLKEQLKRMSSGSPSPLRKRRVAQSIGLMVTPPGGNTVGLAQKEAKSKALLSSIGEVFPPLPQRPPRNVANKSGGDRVPPVQQVSSAAMDGSESQETATEAYYTQQIKALVAARELEKDRKRKEDLGRQQRGTLVEQRKDRLGKNVDKGKGVQDGNRKVGPRVISNVQVVPSFKDHVMEGDTGLALSGSETEWRLVSGGRHKWKNKSSFPPPHPLPGNKVRPSLAVLRGAGSGETSGTERRPPLGQKLKIRPPKTPLSSAVTITGKVDGFSYAAALKSAREHIDLEALGIRTTRVRKAINGGLLIEVAGEDSKPKAEELVMRLQGVLKDSAVVSCPVKKREVRVVGFDESVTSDEIVEVLRSIGGCSIVDIKIGPIRVMNNGLGMAWVQLPVAAAAKVVEEGHIRIGWTVARVELLKVRPLQCYRCWSFGHVQSVCRSVVDRRGACFKCGQQGHMASACQNSAHCAVCHDSGLEASHRLGGPQCVAQMRQDTLSSDRRPIVSVHNV